MKTSTAGIDARKSMLWLTILAALALMISGAMFSMTGSVSAQTDDDDDNGAMDDNGATDDDDNGVGDDNGIGDDDGVGDREDDKAPGADNGDKAPGADNGDKAPGHDDGAKAPGQDDGMKAPGTGTGMIGGDSSGTSTTLPLIALGAAAMIAGAAAFTLAGAKRK